MKDECQREIKCRGYIEISIGWSGELGSSRQSGSSPSATQGQKRATQHYTEKYQRLTSPRWPICANVLARLGTGHIHDVVGYQL